MDCPHCLASFNEEREKTHTVLRQYPGSKEGLWQCCVDLWICPSCERQILDLVMKAGRADEGIGLHFPEVRRERIHPSGVNRKPPALEVYVKDAALAEDYIEACKILTLSPKASAMMGRRCLQRLLEHHLGVKAKNLQKEVEQARAQLPGYIGRSIDVVRQFGNFGAHPQHDVNTGEIVDVQEGEAEWTLDLVEQLLDHLIVKPYQEEKRIEAFNAKMRAAGKPELTLDDVESDE